MWLKELLRKQKRVFSFLKKVKKNANTFFSLNLIKTIYINFKTQKFSDAIKFPIYIYGRLKICTILGSILIEAPIKRGMIKFGFNSDKFNSSKGGAMIILRGKIIFEGFCLFSSDCALDIIGILRIGPFTSFGNGVRIRCWKQITIGASNRIVVDVQLFDTNFHFTRNLETGRVYNRHSPIEIGDFCWIGNRTTIMKGTKLPSYSIVAGNSLLNKDYTKDAPYAPMIAGMPAKIIGSGVVRVFSLRDEDEIAKFFDEHTDAAHYDGKVGVVDEMIEIEDFLNSL